MISINVVAESPVRTGLGDSLERLQAADLGFHMIIRCPRGT
jgi:hypothetical protein